MAGYKAEESFLLEQTAMELSNQIHSRSSSFVGRPVPRVSQIHGEQVRALKALRSPPCAHLPTKCSATSGLHMQC